MHICCLSELFYPYLFGGGEKRYFEIARRLAKRHEVTFYSLNLKGQPKKETIENIEIVRVGSRHPMRQRSLVHLMTYWPAILKALKSEYDIIDANQGISSFAGYAKKTVKKPIVGTFHDIYWDSWGNHFNFPYSAAGKLMEFLWSKACYDKIVAVSEQTKNELETLGFRKNIEIIPNGVDMEKINSIKTKKEENSVVYVGRLINYKNVDVLIRAFERVSKKIPDAKLRIVGSGPQEQELRELAKKTKADIEFTGFVSEERKIEIMKKSKILVNMSTIEGFGIILIEAMASGAAVIARDLPCYTFCNVGNSLIIDEKELSEKIVDVLSKKTVYNRITKNGYETAKKFTWDSIADKTEKVYEELLR